MSRGGEGGRLVMQLTLFSMPCLETLLFLYHPISSLSSHSTSHQSGQWLQKDHRLVLVDLEPSCTWTSPSPCMSVCIACCLQINRGMSSNLLDWKANERTWLVLLVPEGIRMCIHSHVAMYTRVILHKATFLRNSCYMDEPCQVDHQNRGQFPNITFSCSIHQFFVVWTGPHTICA